MSEPDWEGVTKNHICIYAKADMGYPSYHKDYGKHGNFTYVLHPNSPKVWRVYVEVEAREVYGHNYEKNL